MKTKTLEDVAFELKRNQVMLEIIDTTDVTKKDFDLNLLKDDLFYNFMNDLNTIYKKYIMLIKQSIKDLTFEINKEKSARCKNLDEFLEMVFNHE